MVKVSMVPYVKESIKNYPEEVRVLTAATPAAEHLFQVRNQQEAKSLPEKQAIQFHHNVMEYCS